MRGQTNVIFVKGGTKVVKPYCDMTRCTNSWSQYSQVGSTVNHLPYTSKKKERIITTVFACVT